MTTTEVVVVRGHLSERTSHLLCLLERLRKDELRGVTVMRGIAGFGRSGKVHTASLVDLPLDLPIIVEFFDEPSRVDRALKDMSAEFSEGHVMTWAARITEP